MKKPSRKKKRQRKKKLDGEFREPKFSMLSDVLEDLMDPDQKSWLWFGFCVFFAIFLGVHLAQAAISFSIPNIKTTDIVYFGTSPVWFIFVTLFKLAFWLFSVTYIAVFIKRLVRGKNS